MTRKIIIITAPSGSGKTTLVKDLLERLPRLAFSISACTRSPRAGEIDGRDYYFLSLADFEEKLAKGEFLESEMVYPGKYYGTLKSELNRIWENGQFPLVDIDVKGALRIKRQFQGESLSIFIKAPSIETLEQRLRHRGTETEDTLLERLKKADYELSFAPEFDYLLVNDDLGQAKEELYRRIEHFIGCN
ncbi:MAG TPA: guanylate kinase [Edaphocola sp.]|nr:guanylate kinase [Edaphocola sp.]